MLRAPAIQALLIQLASFVAMLALVFAGTRFMQVPVTITLAAFLQGAIAALISRWRAMAPWWLLIQLLFPLAIVLFHAVQLPSWIYLAGFVLLLTLYWTTFRTQVPFYPSTLPVWESVAELLPKERAIRFIDIGSGFGGLVMHLSARRPESAITGIEVAPLPWLVSLLRAQVRRSHGRFVRGDYQRLHFTEYDLVFAYLSPAAMSALWQKARAEMRQGALLLSYEFAIPGIEPDIVHHPVAGGPALYGWRM